MVIVGGGNLGHAIANYLSSYKTGFTLDAVFDISPELIGHEVNGINVYDTEGLVEFIEEHQTDIGVICTPQDSAQEVADKLCFAGVRGVWNFAPVDIEVPSHVALENVHLSDILYSLAYHMNRNK